MIDLYHNNIKIKTHNSESRGQEEEVIIHETKITRPLSELFTRRASQKLANALMKPQLQLTLSYYRPSTFLLDGINKPTMVEIGITNPEYQPLRV